MAQWIRRWSTKPEILGSIPSEVVFFLFQLHHLFKVTCLYYTDKFSATYSSASFLKQYNITRLDTSKSPTKLPLNIYNIFFVNTLSLLDVYKFARQEMFTLEKSSCYHAGVDLETFLIGGTIFETVKIFFDGGIFSIFFRKLVHQISLCYLKKK